MLPSTDFITCGVGLLMFQPGLQTHFPNGRIDARFLVETRPRVYWSRMDVQHADRDQSIAIYSDIVGVGRRPLITCWDGAEARWFPPADVEYQNERSITLGDVPRISGEEYRANWDRDFWPAVVESRHMAYFGAAANFERGRDIHWYRDAKAHTLPPDVRCTIHDYWTGGEVELADRVREWRGIIGMHREYLISECGLNNGTPEQIAAWMTKKWRFWQRQDRCLGLVYFQIFDDVANKVPMGLYDANYQLKQVVFETFPLVAEETGMNATFVLHRRDLIPLGNGKFKVRYPAGSNTIMSVQPGGDVQTRPLDQAGAWETVTDDGTRAVFEDVNGEAWAFPLVG